MNGAESLVRTLLASGVDACFANPGTSGMCFVAALELLADEIGAPRQAPIPEPEGAIKPQLARGKFEPEAVASTLAGKVLSGCGQTGAAAACILAPNSMVEEAS